jgi:hypothetical protein
VERRQASALRFSARRILVGAARDYASVGVPLPSFFLFSFFVARMERSEIRERHSTRTPSPDYASLHPGYLFAVA